jgi:phage gp37-like protein
VFKTLARAAICQRIFEQEVYEVRKPGTYMGAWQMAALANVLSTSIRSVYLLYGGQTVRKDLNRTFLPFG